MLVEDKLIRKFKDLDNNKYEIRQKHNKHYYLLVRKENENGAKIINGSKERIIHELKKIHENTKFMD